jgi:hypothetical protein
MSDRYGDLVAQLREAVLASPGATAVSLRRAVEARAARFGGRAAEAPSLPADVSAFVDKVAQRASQVTADDVAALRSAGYSEDAIFEITAAAALGAGLARLERGLAVLRAPR